jgi:type I restriction enzyme, S subunit
MCQAVRGTTFAEITLEQLRKLKILVPTQRSEQDRIVLLLDVHEFHIQAEEAKLEKLKLLKKGLMSDLLTGRVRVNLDPIEETE